MKNDGAGYLVTSVLYRSHTQTHMQGNEPIIRHKSLTFFTLLGSDSWCCVWTLGFKNLPTLVSRVSGTKAYYHPCLTIFLGFCFSLKMHLFIVLCMCWCLGYVGGGLCVTAHIWRWEHNFQELVLLTFMWVIGSTQIAELVQQVPFPGEPSLQPGF